MPTLPKKSTILIVDDSPINLQVLMTILQDDYAIIAATSGEKALTLARKQPMPDLIILDVMMPDMDGYEVCTQLKVDERTQTIPVIFVTSLSEVGNETKGFELGAVDYLTRPISPPVLKARIKSHLMLQSLHQELQQKNDALATATRVKDDFLANMSHELRTPLNAILGLSEVLQDGVYGALTEEQQHAIATMETSGQHLLELINDILDLSKISAGKLELQTAATSVSTLCNASLLFVKQQAFEKRIQLTYDLPAGLGSILVDERRIRQVLINLLSNAVKFTPEGGEVSLRVAVGRGDTWRGNVQEPEQLVTQPGQLILLQVTDSGIGIAPHDMSRLFQPFTQIDSQLNRNQSGTGLGLAMVKQITEMHGGSVAVESQLGQGSCFTVALPYLKPGGTLPSDSTSLALTPAVDDPDAYFAPLILLAEDNQANVETFTAYLKARGYRCLVATDGEEAIAIAQDQLPDIILMDIQMPGMDGLEATRRLRTDPRLSKTPIIALTALAMTGDEEKCLAAGANHYLSKPVRLRELVTIIQRLLAP